MKKNNKDARHSKNVTGISFSRAERFNHNYMQEVFD